MHTGCILRQLRGPSHFDDDESFQGTLESAHDSDGKWTLWGAFSVRVCQQSNDLNLTSPLTCNVVMQDQFSFVRSKFSRVSLPCNSSATRVTEVDGATVYVWRFCHTFIRFLTKGYAHHAPCQSGSVKTTWVRKVGPICVWEIVVLPAGQCLRNRPFTSARIPSHPFRQMLAHRAHRGE